MKTFGEYFSDESVVDVLIGIRLKSAVRRHDQHFLRNISRDARKPQELAGAADHLLPPRSQWRRPRAELRRRLDADVVARSSIRNVVLSGLQCPTNTQPWLLALRGFLSDIRRRAENPAAFAFEQPHIFALPKENPTGEGHVSYRVLTMFSNLPDRILIGQTAKYLSHLCDPLFLDCSHAFRVSRQCSRTHAVSSVRDYVIARKEKHVYVAECDIRKFFDCIDHGVARQAFNAAVTRLEERGGTVDPRAQTVFDMYMNAYDFFHVGLPAAKEDLKRRGGRDGRIDTPDLNALRKLRGGSEPGRVGIPQGGALSPLIANLVLDVVDRAVLGEPADQDLLYVRFCDDMILMHTERAKCVTRLDTYVAALRSLLLPIHEFADPPRYGKKFYEAKSKSPYRLGLASGGKRASPWVSFLGYQIHWDGAMRVRKESLKRHKTRQTELVQRVLRLIRKPDPQIRVNGRQIVWRVALRLVAVAIGRGPISGTAGTRQPCWTGAFTMLDSGSHAETQMHALDRHRDSLIRKLKRAVVGIKPVDVRPRKKKTPKKQVAMRTRSSSQLPFIGRPLSYWGQLFEDRPVNVLGESRAPDRGSYGTEF